MQEPTPGDRPAPPDDAATAVDGGDYDWIEWEEPAPPPGGPQAQPPGPSATGPSTPGGGWVPTASAQAEPVPAGSAPTWWGPEAASSQAAPTAGPGYATPYPGWNGPMPPPGYGPGPGYGWPGWPGGEAPPGTAPAGRWAFVRRASVAWMVAGVLAVTTVALAAALATSGGSTTTAAAAGNLPGASAGAGAGAGAPFGGGFGGGTGTRPAVFGTVASVGSDSFTVSSPQSGQTYTVNEQSSTTYRSTTGTASASDVAVGDRVAVAGTTSGTTVTATSVVILPAGGFGGPAGAGAP